MGLDIYFSPDYVLPADAFSTGNGSIVNLELRLWLQNGKPLGPEISTNELANIPPKEVNSIELPIIGYTLFVPESHTPNKNYDVKRKILPLKPINYIFKILGMTYKSDKIPSECSDPIYPWVEINGLSCPCEIHETKKPYITLYVKVHPGKELIRTYDGKPPEMPASKD